MAVVGKYVSLPDAYLSVIEALGHAGVRCGCRVNVHLVDGEELSDANAGAVLGGMDGILVPGGFGQRAFEGKIAAARYARKQGIPYLGICLGLQAAVCMFARDAAGMSGATSAEFDAEAAFPVVDLMPGSRRMWRARAEPCAWELIRARWSRARRRSRLTANLLYMSVTVIVMR